jgi:hypothetical protein
LRKRLVMNRHSALAVAVMLMCTFLWQGRACSDAPPAYLSVKDFGAKGDGRTDDTEAIRKAFTEAANAGMKELVFPSGDYIVTEAVRPTISARGPATIWQRNPEADIFYSDWAHQISFSNLDFRGGRSHLSLANPNINSGFIRIEDCTFRKSSGPAVNIRVGTSSTFAIIQHCQFLGCDQTLISHTDWTTMRDCWIGGGAETGNKAVIENKGGKMVLEDILAVPNVTGKDQRWIDNYGNLTCRSFRFGGETGGFTPVVNFARYSTQVWGPSIIIEDSFMFALGNNKRPCGIYLEEIPNIIEVRNCIIGGIPAIKIRPDIDLKNYFKNVRPGMLQYNLTGNVGEFAGEMPELLENPVIVQDETSKLSQLSEADTKQALSEAVAFQKQRPRVEEERGKFADHRQKTDPSDYMEITPDKYTWDLEDLMDGTSEKNARHLAVAQAGDDIIIMRRTEPRNWPHVLIRDVRIDLDTYPYLTWKEKDPGVTDKTLAFAYAVKVIDKETETMLTLIENTGDRVFAYSAYNLKELFGVGGVRSFDIKFYYLATEYIPPSNGKKMSAIMTEPGGYMVLDFLRAEAE